MNKLDKEGVKHKDPELGKELFCDGLDEIQRYADIPSARHAFHCFLLGHRQGDDFSTLYLALCLLCGSGTRRDTSRGYALLNELSEQSTHEDSYAWTSAPDTAQMLIHLLTPLLMPYVKNKN